MKLLTLITFLLTASSIFFGQTAKELEMIGLVNQVRTNPKSFVPVIEAYIKDLETNSSGLDRIKIKGSVITKKTNHSESNTVNLISEAKKLISFLNQVKSVNALAISNTTYFLSKSHASFLDSTKQVTHNGPNGISFAERTNGFLIGENCGTGKTATDALIQLLIDMGNKDKGHRINIFNSKYTSISIGNSGNYWVQDFKL